MPLIKGINYARKFISTLTRMKSLDSAWSAKTSEKMFSIERYDGTKAFFSERATLEAYVNVIGDCDIKTIRSYPIFAPDDLIRKVSGNVSKPKNGKELIAYTDGSFVCRGQNNVGGYGVFCYCGEKTAEYANVIIDNACIFGSLGGELAAAVVAIKVAIAHGYESVDIRHDFDCVAIYEENSTKSPKTTNRLYWIFEQYRDFLECARESINIKFTKVKGHSGDVGNEHANFLANVHAKSAACAIQDRKLKARSGVGATSSGKNHISHKLKDADFEPVWKPQTSEEKNLSWHADKLIANMLRGRDVFVSCQQLEQMFIESDLATRLGLSKSQIQYVRYVILGCVGNKNLCPRMHVTLKTIKNIRRSCARKMGFDEHTDDYQIVRAIVKELVLNDLS